MNIKRKVSYCFLLALQARSKHLHELLKHIKKQNYTVHFDLSASVHLGEPIHASLLRSITSNGNCQNAQRIRTIAYHCNLIPFNWAIYLCAIHLHSILCFEYTDSRSPMTKQAFHIKSVIYFRKLKLTDLRWPLRISQYWLHVDCFVITFQRVVFPMVV